MNKFESVKAYEICPCARYAAEVEALTPTQLEYAYQIAKREKQIQDARTHAAGELGADPGLLCQLTDRDYEELAVRFDQERDPSVPDDKTWADIIYPYASEKYGE